MDKKVSKKSALKKPNKRITKSTKKVPKSPANNLTRNTKQNHRTLTNTKIDARPTDSSYINKPKKKTSASPVCDSKKLLSDEKKFFLKQKISNPIHKIKDKSEDDVKIKNIKKTLTHSIDIKLQEDIIEIKNESPVSNKIEYKPSGGSNIKVVCRIRPPNKAEKVIIV